MTQPNYKQAVLAFGNYHPDLPSYDLAFDEFSIIPLSGGLINHTFKVESKLWPPFLLQQINQHVFTTPEDVQENYIHLVDFAEFEFTGLKLPLPNYYDSMKSLYIDNAGNFWRAFEFIEDGKMLGIAEKPSQAKATAKTFAKFTAAYDDFNIDLLQETIPDFHNLSFRYTQFEESLNGEEYERMQKAMPLVEELKQRERYNFFYKEISESDEFPKRVMHHDAKIANILFSKTTGKVICPVDFDTSMPGYFFSDLGDMIRSMACSLDETSIDFDKITIRKEFYNAIVEGYLSVMEKQLTASEKRYIHYAGLLMIYMQALRYMADYLNGDLYYKINYPEQNFDRAKNQLILLKKLEEFLEKEFQFKA